MTATQEGQSQTVLILQHRRSRNLSDKQILQGTSSQEMAAAFTACSLIHHGFAIMPLRCASAAYVCCACQPASNLYKGSCRAAKFHLLSYGTPSPTVAPCELLLQGRQRIGQRVD